VITPASSRTATEVWARAAGRMADLQADDWTEIVSEHHRWEEGVVELVVAGESPTGLAAMALAEEHRRSIERRYFTCPPALHRELVEALHADPGLRTRYERLAPGTADFIRAAVTANATRAERSAAGDG
jgi:hypothetical protein